MHYTKFFAPLFAVWNWWKRRQFDQSKYNDHIHNIYALTGVSPTQIMADTRTASWHAKITPLDAARHILAHVIYDRCSYEMAVMRVSTGWRHEEIKP